MTHLSPREIVNLVLRNIVPVVGLLFYHWYSESIYPSAPRAATLQTASTRSRR